MKNSSEIQNQKVARLAKEQGITPGEYKRRCEENTAKNKGLTLAEYHKEKNIRAAHKKGLTEKEYRQLTSDKTARNKGFRDKRDYDKADKRAKVLQITREQYCSTLEKDEEGFYILPKVKMGKPKKAI